MQEGTLEIKGMTCEGCVATVRKVISSQPGVGKVDVDLCSGKAVVSFDGSKTSLAKLAEAVCEAGFEARELGS